MTKDYLQHLFGVLSLSVSALAFAPLARAQPITLPAQVPFLVSHGIQLQSWTQVDADGPGGAPPSTRLYEATMTTSAIFVHGDHVPVKVRVLFPSDYQTWPPQSYPMVLLLHGVGGSSADWSNNDIQAIVDAQTKKMIVVMPDGGLAGWYGDWFGPTDGGFTPEWETFHMKQLLPWIDDNLRTLKTRDSRTLAGLSMGGYGALRYAANYSAQFSAIGSFSGVADLQNEELQGLIAQSMYIFGATEGGSGLLDPRYRMTFPTATPYPQAEETHRLLNLFGPQVAGDWPSANPSAMSLKYQGLKLGLYVGRGTQDQFETNMASTNDTLHGRLNAAGVLHRYCTGDGIHQFPYWREDLKDFLQYVTGAISRTEPVCTHNANWHFQP